MAREHAASGAKHSRVLVGALVLNASYMVVEAVVGFATGSLVLLADAGHMLTDVAGVSLALLAVWFAQRPANQRKTYGYYRIEILAALANALLLFGVSAYILYEAYTRFTDPPDVPSAPLLIVASIGLLVNLAGAFLLARGAAESMNIRAAFLDMIADVIASVGAITAGIVIMATGWRYADPLFAAAVGLFILPRTWGLLKGALDVLLEGTPSNIKIPRVQETILTIPGIKSVHDLHVWTVNSGFVALSGHVEVTDDADRDRILIALRSELERRFAIEHVTIQVENERLAAELEQPCFPGQTVCYADSSRVTNRARS
jgi:cobalt-zinc-cadmium efflux system protein